jgi:hypothetical protein
MNIAIIKNDLVENVVLVDDVDEGLVILGQVFPESVLVPVVEETTGTAYIGLPYQNGKFVPFKPYDSWSFNEATWSWDPPVSRPDEEDGVFYFWNESSLSWDIPTIDEEL